MDVLHTSLLTRRRKRVGSSCALRVNKLLLVVTCTQGPETCFAVFLPALVMGNFLVLNLFLALLLNSFSCEELKSRKQVSAPRFRLFSRFIERRGKAEPGKLSFDPAVL